MRAEITRVDEDMEKQEVLRIYPANLVDHHIIDLTDGTQRIRMQIPDWIFESILAHGTSVDFVELTYRNREDMYH